MLSETLSVMESVRPEEKRTQAKQGLVLEGRPATAQEAPESSSSEHKDLAAVATKLQSAVEKVDVKLQIQVDLEKGRTVVKLINGQTGDVLRQIPSEELLKLQDSLDRMIGLFFNKAV